MKVLDLFSGIGGFSLGLDRAGMETVAFCEIEDYPVKVLNKHWPNVPVHRDIRKLDGKQYRDSVDVICGGFPCQPFSVAGKQRGKEDNRHLWPEMLRIIKEVRPAWVIGENVAGFIRMALDDVLLDLEAEGYTTQSFVVPACAVGGIHRRDRVWVLGYSEHNGRNGPQDGQSDSQGNDGDSKGQNEAGESEGSGCQGRDDANTNLSGLQGGGEKSLQGFTNIQGKLTGSRKAFRAMPHPTQPAVCGANDGVSDRVARLKALGNAVVPQIPEMIGRAIMESQK